MTQASQQTKFRWTENLTCRFIQLRKENGKLFTGRKYSAQAGWEYILQQMREEFPTIMADVHYRVLKKKWSNLLQQYKNGNRKLEVRVKLVGVTQMAWKYDRIRPAQPILLLCICHSDLLKELKNPVHGDRNKADDVSWPFYSAIDEVLGHGRRTPNNDEYIDPHEFLCVSVTPEEPTSSVDALPAGSNPEDDSGREPTLVSTQKLRSFNDDYLTGIETASHTQQSTRQASKNPSRRKRDTGRTLISRLPRATEVSIEKVPSQPDSSKDLSRSRGSDIVDSTKNKGQVTKRRSEDEESPRKLRRTRARYHEDHESRIDRYIQEIFEYTKRRDEENRSIMTRIMHAVETIANKL